MSETNEKKPPVGGDVGRTPSEAYYRAVKGGNGVVRHLIEARQRIVDAAWLAHTSRMGAAGQALDDFLNGEFEVLFTRVHAQVVAMEAAIAVPAVSPGGELRDSPPGL